MVCVSFYFQDIIHKCLIAQMYVYQVDTCCPQGSAKDIKVSAARVIDIWVLGSESWASTTATSTELHFLLTQHSHKLLGLFLKKLFYYVLLSFPIANHFLSTFFVAVCRLQFVFSLWPVKLGHSATLHTGLH